MLFDILVVVSLLVTLLLLRRLVNVYPSLIACLWRAKECFNLESSDILCARADGQCGEDCREYVCRMLHWIQV